MTAEELLDQLEKQELLETKLIDSLRRQVRESKKKVTARALAKLLIDKGQLTPFQAKKLLPEESAAAKTEASDAKAKAEKEKPADKQKKEKKPPEENPPEEEEIIELGETGGLTPLPPEAPAAEGLMMLTEENAVLADPLADMSGPGGGLTGLSDSLPGAASLEGGDALMPGMAPATQAKPTKDRKKVKKGTWDSPLMLAGGGILLVLLIGGFFLIFVLFRGSSDEMFNAAEQNYRDQSYSQAIDSYNKFLKKFPRDKNVSLARVKRGMARLQLPVKSGNWTNSLETAQQILPEIESEKKFSEAREELAGLLPKIVMGFGDDALASCKNNRIEQARQLFDSAQKTLELVNNGAYIPTSQRKQIENQLDRIDELMTKVRRLIEQDEKLKAAIVSINQAIDEGRTSDAYAIRKTLLSSYPAVEQHPELLAAVGQITDKQRDLVAVWQLTQTPSTDDAQTDNRLSAVISAHRGGGVSDAGGRVVVVKARGSVYGLSLADGSVLWRRFIGFSTDSHPRRISREQNADALLVDRAASQLLRVGAADGKLIWKLPLEGSTDPVVEEGRIFTIANTWTIQDGPGENPQWWTGQTWTDDAKEARQYESLPDAAGVSGKSSALAVGSGGLAKIETASGKPLAGARFPQPLPAGPTLDTKRGKLYLLGEHSNLYVLSSDQLQCQTVHYLGHKPGSIAVPPLETRGLLLVAENAERNNSLLRVMELDQSGSELKQVQEFRLGGHVVVPMRIYENRVLLVTDRGEIYFLEVDPNNADAPVSAALRFDSALKEPVIGYPLAADGLLWIGDSRFSKFKIQTALGKLNREWIKDEGIEFVGPLQKAGPAVIRLRRLPGSLGVEVSAVDLDEAETLWETVLAAPLAGPAMPGADNSAHVVSAQGDLFQVDQAALDAGRGGKPLATVAARPPLPLLSQAVDAGAGDWLFWDESDRGRVVLFQNGGGKPSLKRIGLSISGGQLAGEPVVFRDGLLVPTNQGQVFWLDRLTGGKMLLQNKPVLPFQPPLEAGVKISWRRAAVAGDQFVIADDRRRVFRVGLQTGDRPHLSALKQADLDFPAVAPLAVIGQTVYCVTRDPQAKGDTLLNLALDDLSIDEQRQSLTGRIAQGPRQVGDAVLLSTTAGALYCLEEAGKQRWQVNLSGPLAAPPLARGDDFLLVTRSGLILLVDGKTGEESARLDSGEPLATVAIGPGDKLWLGGADGTVHVVAMPQRPAQPSP